jgi:hypothetical protein
MRERTETLKKKKDISINNRGKVETLASCNCDIKCFCCLGVNHVTSQCPNKRAMVMKAPGEVVTVGEVNDEEKLPTFKDVNDDCVKYPIEREALMVK